MIVTETDRLWGINKLRSSVVMTPGLQRRVNAAHMLLDNASTSAERSFAKSASKEIMSDLAAHIDNRVSHAMLRTALSKGQTAASFFGLGTNYGPAR